MAGGEESGIRFRASKKNRAEGSPKGQRDLLKLLRLLELLELNGIDLPARATNDWPSGPPWSQLSSGAQYPSTPKCQGLATPRPPTPAQLTRNGPILFTH